MSFGKLFLAALLITLTGCATQAPSVRIRVAGGEKITVDLARGGAVGPVNKDLKIGGAGVLLNDKEKKGAYAFSIEMKSDAVLRSVKIEDVTEATAQAMVDDPNPKVVGRTWRWVCPLVGPDDKSMAWIHDIDESFRVYRFTIALGDGRQIVMHFAAFYPAYTKMRLRNGLGAEAH